MKFNNQRLFLDYVIKFELFGSYESSLLSCEYPIIDCYISIKRTDSSDDELSYAEKLKVFEQLPFKNSKRFETAFLGYLVEWRTKHFKEKFFFTMDPKASNAVLSSVGFFARLKFYQQFLAFNGIVCLLGTPYFGFGFSFSRMGQGFFNC